MSEATCDFCLRLPTPPAVWHYTAEVFLDQVFVGHDGEILDHYMDEDWMACAEHAALIEQGLDAMMAWADLHVDEWMGGPFTPRHRALALRNVRATWSSFINLRRPGRVPVTEAERAVADQTLSDGLEVNAIERQWIDRHMK